MGRPKASWKLFFHKLSLRQVARFRILKLKRQKVVKKNKMQLSSHNPHWNPTASAWFFSAKLRLRSEDDVNPSITLSIHLTSTGGIYWVPGLSRAPRSEDVSGTITPSLVPSGAQNTLSFTKCFHV